MTDTTQLPESVRKRIEKEAKEFVERNYHDSDEPSLLVEMYKIVAEYEAGRAQVLIEALDKIGTMARSLTNYNWVEVNTVVAEALNQYTQLP